MDSSDWTVLVARFESMCWGCGGMIEKKTLIWNNRELKRSKHLMCKNKELSDAEA